jgi:hypothetical protein
MKTYEIGTKFGKYIVIADLLDFRDSITPDTELENLFFYRESMCVAVFIEWEYWIEITEKNVDNCK